jgi:Fe-S cluster assembly scaffold protein SufB
MNPSSSMQFLSSQNDLTITTNEPEWFKEFRAKVWNAFQLLPLESDQNMLNFLQTKTLNDFQFSYPPESLFNPKTVIFTDKSPKLQFTASPNSEELTISEEYQQNKKILFQSLYSLLGSENVLVELLNSILELKISDKLIAVALATIEWGSYLKFGNNFSSEDIISLKIENPLEDIKSGLHIIQIGDNSNVSIDLTFDSHSNEFDHSLTFIVTGANSHVNILVNDAGILDRKTNRGFMTKIGKDSSVNFAQIQVDGKYIRQRAEFYFSGEGGDLVEVACLRAYQKQDYDFYSAVYHSTPKCTSHTYARGVNDDESKTIFKGKVDIGKNGGKTNTDLSLHGLLLSKKAKFHSFPGMEVINNDVIATHGASVSQIDPEQIFYFLTRGIDKENAEYMIASGYFEPALSKIRSPILQAKTREIIGKAVEEQFSLH